MCGVHGAPVPCLPKLFPIRRGAALWDWPAAAACRDEAGGLHGPVDVLELIRFRGHSTIWEFMLLANSGSRSPGGTAVPAWNDGGACDTTPRCTRTVLAAPEPCSPCGSVAAVHIPGAQDPPQGARTNWVRRCEATAQPTTRRLKADDSQIQVSLPGRHIGDIRYPEPVRRLCVEAPLHPVRGAGHARHGAWCAPSGACVPSGAGECLAGRLFPRLPIFLDNLLGYPDASFPGL